jgi:serine/threonine protein kinase
MLCDCREANAFRAIFKKPHAASFAVKLLETIEPSGNEPGCLVLEWGERTLQDEIESAGRLDVLEGLGKLKQMLNCLQWLHDAGFMHGDVKVCRFWRLITAVCLLLQAVG